MKQPAFQWKVSEGFFVARLFLTFAVCYAEVLAQWPKATGSRAVWRKKYVA